MLFARAATTPDAVALRVKRRGCWQATTWRAHAEQVAVVARGLAELGVGVGGRVAIQADNRPEWLVADLAAQALGAASVAVSPVAEPGEIAPALVRAKATIAFAEDEEQVDKLLAVRAKLKKLQKVVVVDPRGIDMSDPWLMSFAELELLGADSDLDVAAIAAAVDPDSEAADGRSHRELLAAADRAAEATGTDPRCEVLSFLPLGRLDERVVSEVNAVRVGYVVNFGDGGDALAQDLHEVQPTCVLGVPELWQTLMAGVTARMAGAGRVHRLSYQVWFGIGLRIGRRRRAGEPLSILDRLRDGAAWVLLQRPLQARLGLTRARTALAGDGVDAQVVDFFWAIGVPLRDSDGLGGAR
jgi:long-chain acyl-CoA synthetase